MRTRTKPKIHYRTEVQSLSALDSVRQAHMPGNYELYDRAENKLGPVICKLCWELHEKRNSTSLNTVWVNSEGRRMVWWLCGGHLATLKNEAAGSAKYIRSSEGFITSPGL